MMRGIKYALAFLWGAAFASSVWYWYTYPSGAEEIAVGTLLSGVFSLLSLTAIGVMVLCFFADHWEDN